MAVLSELAKDEWYQFQSKVRVNYRDLNYTFLNDPQSPQKALIKCHSKG
jgi:hypothetical protein